MAVRALALFGAVLVLCTAGTLCPARNAAAAEDDIGRRMEREYGVVRDDTREGRQLNAQLDRVVERVLGGVNQGRRAKAFELRSAKLLGGRSEKLDRVINAFALPDGRIYVTLGLARAVQDSQSPDDELAFVVGHEVTHVVERHSQKQQKEALKSGIAAIILGAVTKSRVVGGAAGAGAAAYTSSFSRKDEYAADKGGLQAMHRAGYDMEASISMMKRLKRAGGSEDKALNGWFGSHPLTENRIDKLNDLIRKIKEGRTLDD